MLEFKEVTYLYRLRAYYGVEEINTTEGYARIDYDKGFYQWPIIAVPGVPTTLWHFLKGGSTLYLMRKEPIYYA